MATYYSKPHVYKVKHIEGSTAEEIAKELHEKNEDYELSFMYSSRLKRAVPTIKLLCADGGKIDNTKVILIDYSNLPTGRRTANDNDDHKLVLSKSVFEENYEPYLDGYWINKERISYNVEAFQYNEKDISSAITWLMSQHKSIV